jgi:hypothetical protein
MLLVLRIYQLSTESVILFVFIELMSVFITENVNSTLICITKALGFSIHLTNLLLLVNKLVINPTLILERSPPKRNKTLQSLKLLRNGWINSSQQQTLLKTNRLLNWKKHQRAQVILILWQKYFKFSNLMSTPMNLSLKISQEKFSIL